MENIIFYFTGTGNSLSIAREIADKIDDTKLIAIPDAMNEEDINLSYERIGFVFPVYYANVPSIVKRFIEKLNFNKTQYIYGVITFGGSYGSTLSKLRQCVEERGGVLNAGFSVRLPGNYIDKYNAWPSFLQNILFKKEKKKAYNISVMVMGKKLTRIPKGSAFSNHYESSVSKILADFGKMAENFHTTEKCNGCRTCERVCPVNNIKIVDSRPKWGNTCEHCVACIQWCPVKAIEYADKTQKRKQYRHPKVEISDIIK